MLRPAHVIAPGPLSQARRTRERDRFLRRLRLLRSVLASLLVGGSALGAAPEDASIAPAPSALTLGDGVQLRIGAGAQVGAPRGMQLPVGRGSALVRVQSVPVLSGRVDMSVDGELGSRGGMLTVGPKFLAVCTGGRMTVIAEPDAIVVIAHDHDLLLGYGGRFRPLPHGFSRRFDLRTTGFSDAPILDAPVTTARPSLASALEGPVRFPLPVAPVLGAVRYLVRLSPFGDERSVHEESFSDPSEVSVTPPLPGRYHARLIALDAFGIESRSSAPLELRVIGVAERERLVHRGSIHLEPGARVGVLGGDGLIMRYGASSEFIPAMNTIGLPHREATRVEFRDPSDPRSIVVFPLIPEMQRARIELGKATTEWPRDALPIRIRFDGPRDSSSSLGSLRAEVLVNLTPVELEFVEKDGELVAELAPQPGPGPWVVRVSLRNAKGVELARNFLEIVEEKSALRPTSSGTGSVLGRTERRLRRVE